MLIEPLFDGPLDLIGDVHGEIEALRALLERLGYDRHGEHPQRRRLVFVGDLCDRGPDSPAVLRLVRTLVERGLAQCVAGNHELNVLRRENKDGNHWFHGQQTPRHLAKFGPCVLADEEVRHEALAFFGALPLALERADLRVVHAAWEPEAIARCRALDATGPMSALEAYGRFDDVAGSSAEGRALHEAHEEAQHQHRERLHRQEDGPPAFLEAVAAYDEHYQMSNPVRVLSSGVERRLDAEREPSFYAGGKWRFVKRVPWWLGYADAVPVVFGHYWRWFHPHGSAHLGEPRGGDDFDDGLPGPALHDRARAICIDFSVGARFKERKRGATPPFQTRLCALRWDERRVIFDGEDPPRLPG